VDLATAKQLRFGLALAPLLSGRVQVTEMALIEPVITMPEPGAKTTAPAGDAGAAGPSIATALQSLSLDSLLIEDGTVILRGQGGNPGKRIEIVTLAASLPSLTGPLSLELKARFDGKPLGVVGSIASFGPFLDGTPSQILLDVDAPAQFPQRLALTGTATYTGDMLALDAFSARAPAMPWCRAWFPPISPAPSRRSRPRSAATGSISIRCSAAAPTRLPPRGQATEFQAGAMRGSTSRR
jgi:hypothetical protein